MASYPHPGTGPSNYYQHPHQLQHPSPYSYNPHSPAPYPPQYQQYPHPMNGHAHHMHRTFHPHHLPHPHYNYTQPPQHTHHNPHSPGPYPPHSTQYSTSYTIHANPSWQQQQQQPLSPLPKQLSTLPSLSLPPPAHHHQPQDLPQSNQKTSGDQIGNQNTDSDSVRPEHENENTLLTPQSTATPPPTSMSSPHPSPTRSTPPSMSPARSTTDPKLGGWVIWSKRPSDPSTAPGIIISPHARPPRDVIKFALNIPTPPPSPTPEPLVSFSCNVSAPQPSTSMHPPSEHPDGTESTTTPALSTAPDTPVPSSPLSTNTSFSITKVPDQAEENPPLVSLSDAALTTAEVSIEPSTYTASTTEPEVSCPATIEAPTAPTSVPTAFAESQVSSAPSLEVPEPSISISVPAALAEPEVLSAPSLEIPQPSTFISTAPIAEPEVSSAVFVQVPKSSTSAVGSSTSTATSTPPPAAKATPKSWASLLRTPGSSNLPTSSVMGFSIPASLPSAIAAPKSVPHPKKSELLNLLSSGVSSALAVRIKPRGLVNSGNLCFANAVLQVLVYCPPFWRFFTDLRRLLEPTAESKTPLVDATIRFVKEFAPKDRAPVEGKGKGVERYGANGLVHEEVDDDIMESFMPTYVHDALKEKKRFDHMRGGHQEDAEEFLGFYLDTLEEELLTLSTSLDNPNPAPAHQNGNAAKSNVQEEGWHEVGKRNRAILTRTVKTPDSPMTRIFGGKFRSVLRVPHQKDSVIVEDWRSLRLDIQRDTIHTIKDALAHISLPQAVQVTSVTRPGATLDASQQVHIESLPPILILHLKRFLYDAKKGGVAKVGKQVAFSPELEIGAEAMTTGRKVHSTRYRLFGALYHHGLSASGGHYTLDVLHPNIDMSVPPAKPREGWIRIDDELVSDVRPEDVFGPAERDDRCAYLLFYRKVGGVRTL